LWERSREAARQLHKEGISLSPQEGRLVQFLVQQMAGPRFIEIGSLTGYSALWILAGLRAGFPGQPIEFYTFEKDPAHAQVTRQILLEATAQWWPAGGARVEVWEGDARVRLPEWADQHPGQTVDGIFIDGNKSAYGDYLRWAETRLRPGAVIFADNVFLRGQVWGTDAESANVRFSAKQVEVMHQFNQRLADPQFYDSITLPTNEGLTVARFR
jgi:predicted O-methyltransferase YrrM